MALSKEQFDALINYINVRVKADSRTVNHEEVLAAKAAAEKLCVEEL